MPCSVRRSTTACRPRGARGCTNGRPRPTRHRPRPHSASTEEGAATEIANHMLAASAAVPTAELCAAVLAAGRHAFERSDHESAAALCNRALGGARRTDRRRGPAGAGCPAGPGPAPHRRRSSRPETTSSPPPSWPSRSGTSRPWPTCSSPGAGWRRCWGPVREILSLCERALHALPPEEEVRRARLMGAMCHQLVYAEPLPAIERRALDAYRLARVLDDPEAVGHAATAYRLVADHRPLIERRARRARRHHRGGRRHRRSRRPAAPGPARPDPRHGAGRPDRVRQGAGRLPRPGRRAPVPAGPGHRPAGHGRGRGVRGPARRGRDHGRRRPSRSRPTRWCRTCRSCSCSTASWTGWPRWRRPSPSSSSSSRTSSRGRWRRSGSTTSSDTPTTAVGGAATAGGRRVPIGRRCPRHAGQCRRALRTGRGVRRRGPGPAPASTCSSGGAARTSPSRSTSASAPATAISVCSKPCCLATTTPSIDSNGPSSSTRASARRCGRPTTDWPWPVPWRGAAGRATTTGPAGCSTRRRPWPSGRGSRRLRRLVDLER